jgi:hypothetical protein
MTRRRTRRDFSSVVVTMLCLLAGSVFLNGACSLMLDTDVTQCRSDQDCGRFAGSLCDVVHRVCVGRRDAGVDVAVPAVEAGGADVCVGASGCFSCAPTNESEILSQCTNTVCVPFDNKRLTLLGADGGLRPLP